MKVQILSGIPGCGKTHFANQINEAVIVSTDDEFYNQYEDYIFDQKKLGEYHSNCLFNFMQAVASTVPHIIVDNTNIHHWERQNYLKVASEAHYEIEVIYFTTPTMEQVKKCVDRQTHGVPTPTILQMAFEHEVNDYASFNTRIIGA